MGWVTITNAYVTSTSGWSSRWPDPWCVDCGAHVGRYHGDYVVPCPLCGRRKAGGVYVHLDGTASHFAQTSVAACTAPEPIVIDPDPPHWVSRAAHRAAHVSAPPVLPVMALRRAVERRHRSSVRRFRAGRP